MAHLLLEVTLVTVVVVFLGCSILVLLRQRKGRLATVCPFQASTQTSALAHPVVFPLAGRSASISPASPEVARVSGLTLREAEDLLDWLEHNSYQGRRLVCEADNFAVEFRVDPSHELRPAPHVPRTASNERSSTAEP